MFHFVKRIVICLIEMWYQKNESLVPTAGNKVNTISYFNYSV
jgi:hypothetical protein